MDKHAVAQVFEQIAAFLELKGDNPFRVRAYENAARAIATFPGDLAAAAQSGELGDVRGLGKASIEIVRDLVTTGHTPVLDDLRREIPPGLVEMLKIPGLGVAKVKQIHEHLGIDTLAALEQAARDGRLATIPKFGKKTADNVLTRIGFLRQASEFRLFHHAQAEARAAREALAAAPGVARAEIAGDVRRCREIIGTTDVVVAADSADRLAERAPKVKVVVTAADRFGIAWMRATGSADHVAQLEQRARERGVDLNGPFADEEGAYRALGLAWIPPELREGTGEIAAAAAGKLPRLVERADLKGFVHCHSNYSDGTPTVAEWARAAREAGYAWIAITDHSQGAAYAGGMRVEEIANQHAEIDAANATPSCRVLKGIEADILADGRLDYGAAVLDRFELVIGSVHSIFGLTSDEMTRRLLTAMEDPHLTILGHPTGRLLLSRDGYPLDVERILGAAAERGVAVEINADPHRLDLDWRAVRQARDLGVTLAIGADAHSTGGMANVEFGVGIARKGWLEAKDVLNARDADQLLAFARARRSR